MVRLFAATSAGARMLGIGGGTAAGFAAISAAAINGNANTTFFNLILPGFFCGATAAARLTLT